jgi:hypothetical protein
MIFDSLQSPSQTDMHNLAFTLKSKSQGEIEIPPTNRCYWLWKMPFVPVILTQRLLEFF